jgi:2-dehydro-3-deoxygalactonokinase
LIALDWGTTSLRAYRVDGQGAILDKISTHNGILNVADGDFERVFNELTAAWRDRRNAVPVVACGMIGSRQGWYEAPYIACPAGATEIAGQLSVINTHSGARVWLVPGLSFTDASGVPDVMRGEETQIIGELQITQSASQVFVLPGTHSKWVRVGQGRITWFATFMSGEVFALLCRHSILGRLMQDDDGSPDSHAFRRGLDYAAVADPGSGGLLKRLFSARTLALFDKLPATAVRSYLSGLIIGSEISEGLACLGAGVADGGVSVIGNSELARLYVEALDHRGVSSRPGTTDAVVAGLFRIAGAAGLLEDSHVR